MEITHHESKRHGRIIAWGIVLLSLGSISLHWGWNSFAVEVLNQSSVSFRQALAIELFLALQLVVFFGAWRLFKGSR
jgi:hypothetical protein